MKTQTDKFFPYITVVGIVAIVAIISLVLSGVTGAATLPLGQEKVDSFVPDCVDLEPANDYYVRGIAQQGPTEYQDYCDDGQLYQWECTTSNTIKRTHGFDCATGCQNGVCK